jgi:hypothetical protein
MILPYSRGIANNREYYNKAVRQQGFTKELDEAAGCHLSGDIMTPTTTRGKEPQKE